MKMNKVADSAIAYKRFIGTIMRFIPWLAMISILLYSGCDETTSSDSGTNPDFLAVVNGIKDLDYNDIGFADGEDQTTVESDFRLPDKGVEETSIVWNVGDTLTAWTGDASEVVPNNVVSVNGRSATVQSLVAGYDYIEVTLTATVSRGNVSDTKTFTIKVLAPNDIEPGPPENLIIVDRSTEFVTLKWDASLPGRSDGKRGTINRYTVYFNTVDDFTELIVLTRGFQYADSQGTSVSVGGLDPGKQYYFAVTATNKFGNSAVSDSVATYTNTHENFIPEAPVIISRIASESQVELIWAVPTTTGWIDEQPIVISSYRIYQDTSPITDVSGLTPVAEDVTGNNWVIDNLPNSTPYYFAITAMMGETESPPGGGDVSVTPSGTLADLSTIGFRVLVDDSEVLTNTINQSIPVVITDPANLVYGRDYTIALSREGQTVSGNLSYDSSKSQITVSETLKQDAAGTYTLTAGGTGSYNGAISDDFELTVNLGDGDLLDLASKALDYGDMQFADEENEKNVHTDFILPLIGLHDAAISWISSDGSVIRIDGESAIVTEPTIGTPTRYIYLTATLSLNAETQNKKFLIIVPSPMNMAPGSPKNITLKAWSTDSVSLSWTESDPGYENGMPGSIGKYTIYYNETNDFTDLVGLKTANQYVEITSGLTGLPEILGSVSNLTTGTRYYIAVTAVNGIGEGPYSSPVSTYTNSLPEAPVILIRNAGNQEATITWVAPQSAGWKDGQPAVITDYLIYREETSIEDVATLTAIDTVIATQTMDKESYTSSGLTNGKEYYFAIVAKTDMGMSAPGGGTVSVIPNDAAVDLASTGISISVNNGEEFTAESGTVGQNIPVVITDPSTPALVYGQDYTIVLSREGKAAGGSLVFDSAMSQITISETLMPEATGVYTLSASGMGNYNGQIETTFTLTINLSDADAVKLASETLYKDITELFGGDLEAVSIDAVSLPSEGAHGTQLSWQSSDDALVDVTTGLINHPSVGFPDGRVVLTATVSKAQESAEKTFVLIIKAQIPPVSNAPGLPEDLTVTDWEENSISLSWTIPSDTGLEDGQPGTIGSYTIYYSDTDNFVDLSNLHSVTGITGTSETVSNLNPGTQYYFAVAAVNGFDTGLHTATVGTVTDSAPGEPVLMGRDAGDKQVKLTWLAPASAGWKDGQSANIVSYAVYQSTNEINDVNNLTPVHTTSDGSTMTHTASGLTNGITYYFAVSADTDINGSGAPGGGEVGVKPMTDVKTLAYDAQVSLNMDDATVWTNTKGQIINITLDDRSLIYERDYRVSISKSGVDVPELIYDFDIKKIRVSETIPITWVGTEVYTVTMHGVGSYSGTVSDNFKLTIRISDVDAVAIDKQTLAMPDGVDPAAVTVAVINLPSLGVNGSTITWSSNKPEVISDDGMVTRPDIGLSDDTVILTASIKKNLAADTRDFKLTVKALEYLGDSPPGAPQDLQATAGEEMVTLTWIAPADRGSIGGQVATVLIYSISGYETANPGNTIPSIGRLTGTSAVIKNLQYGIQYTFAVTASNGGILRSEATHVSAIPKEPGTTTEITDISYTTTTLNVLTGQTIMPLKPSLEPGSVPADNIRVSYNISPTDFESVTGLIFDENTGIISGTASVIMESAVDYTITVIPDTDYYSGTPSATISVQVEPFVGARYNPIEAPVFASGTWLPILENENWVGTYSAQSLPVGLNIDPNTGEIYGKAQVLDVDGTDYTIDMTGRDSYIGLNSSTTVNIKVLRSLGKMSYVEEDLVYGNGKTFEPGWTGTADGTPPTVSYALIRPVNGVVGIDLNTGTGAVTVDKSIDSGTYTLTIEATGTGNFNGLKTQTEFTIIVRKANISGTLSYMDIEVPSGETGRANASLSEVYDYSQTIKYSLITPIDGISIDERIGVITVDASVLTTGGNYDVQAEGIGNFQGTVASSITVAIRAWLPDDLILTYSPIRVQAGEEGSGLPQWNGGSGYTLTYVLEPQGGGELPNGISINEETGAIRIAESTAEQAETTYRVTATGTGNWKGWRKTDVQIGVYGSFYYEYQPALVGQSYTISPVASSGVDSYSISSPLPQGLTLEQTNGVISGIPTTRQLAREYRVTVELTGGGESTASLNLFIKERATGKSHLENMISEELGTQGNYADLNLIDTSLITNMDNVFSTKSDFNGDISQWDVSSVTSMANMFYEADSFNGDISQWDVSSVTSMANMFTGADSFNGDISQWNVSKVTEMNSMFERADSFNADLSHWNVSMAQNMNSMFYGADLFNSDLSHWDVTSVTDMNSMFNGADIFNSDLSQWKVLNVTDMSNMFYLARFYNGDLSQWQVSKVTSMHRMFQRAYSFNSELSQWIVSSVEHMEHMFDSARSFNRDLDAWSKHLNPGLNYINMFDNSGLVGNEPSWY